MYKLVFFSFTGVDNYKHCVSFVTGLLMKEDVELYIWLLEHFKEAMDHSPSCIVTNQDPTMKIMVARVLYDARRQFCMWHIMTKVGEKLGTELANDEVFQRKLNALVWNESLTIEAFELGWQNRMLEYGLSVHSLF